MLEARSCRFLGVSGCSEDDYRCLDVNVTTGESGSAERLPETMRTFIDRAIRALCWSFWQAVEPFPSDALSQKIEEFLKKYIGTKMIYPR